MKYRNRPLREWKMWGYNLIHLIGDYYLLRKYPKPARRFSLYVLAKIRRDDYDRKENS